MKSPWRFLADLTSRRKPDPETALIRLPPPETVVEDVKRDLTSSVSVPAGDPMVGSRSNTETVITPEGQAPSAATEREPETEDHRQSSAVELSKEAVTAADPAADEEPLPATAIEQEPSDAPVQGRIARAKRVKPRKQRSSAPMPAIAVDEPDQQEPRPKPSDFLGDVTSLDEEIRALRSALANKLKKQNTQLREMLARYETR